MAALLGFGVLSRDPPAVFQGAKIPTVDFSRNQEKARVW
jgi:hypothetical protein